MRALIIGSGRMARIRSAALATGSSPCELTFATRNRERAQELAEEFEGRAITMDQIPSLDVDSAFVTSATADHRNDLELALTLGVPILAEKPIAVSSEEGAELAAAASSRGVPLIVGFQRRFDQGFSGLRNAVESGDIGRIYLMRSSSMDHTPGSDEFIATSAGIFRDLFVHDIESAMWLTGQSIISVYAFGDSRISDAYAKHDDCDVATIIAVMADGLSVTMHGIRHDPIGQDVRWEIFGSKMAASAGLGRRTPIVAIDDLEATCHGSPLTFQERFSSAFRDETLSFMSSIESGSDFVGCTAVEAAFVSRVAEACERSQRLGEPVSVR